MYVLGLSGGYGHDAAAALVEDGTILAAAEEERFIRRKRAFDETPVHAAAYCLAAAGIGIEEVDCIAIAWSPDHPPPWPARLHEDLLAHPLFAGRRSPPVEIVSHPLAHAVAAFRTSGFDEAAVLIMDGQGDGISTTLAHGTRNGVAILDSYDIEDSLGIFYWALTTHLGWTWGEEGKVMGLAPYGRNGHGPAAFEVAGDSYRSNIRTAPADGHYAQGMATYTAWRRFLDEHHGPPARARYTVDPLTQRASRAVEVTDRERAIAAWGQGELERVLRHMANVVIERTGCSNLVFGGGAAYNCTANGALRADAAISDVYVFPASGDAGTSVGAALAVSVPDGSSARCERVDHAAFGPDFDDDDIARMLRDSRIAARRSDEVCSDAAKLIASDCIVAWFQGRMELGPRALGSRSILASPLSTVTRDRVNAIKRRESWRPLAPSLLADAAAEYLVDPRPAPFMLTATKVREDRRDMIPGVVHVDGSCRPQTVNRDAGTRYAGLLARLGELTGVPVVLNTSFNVGDEPIVLSPRDALRSFFASGLEALVIGDCIVEKRSPG
ncbi:MAG TPA: carbamoyltransferase C-terminal domain-containing protein [Solirubrobacteraceae bacterium]|nr:carbamoyltransferase C-terminal domain-containing protein [Solirubrobacteraceae bacterium]